MTLGKGSMEMIGLANAGQPKSFNDFTKISIGKKRLSSATVSKRLKEMIVIKVLEEVVIRSDTGRRIIGYKTTERGKKILEIGKELERAMKK